MPPAQASLLAGVGGLDRFGRTCHGAHCSRAGTGASGSVEVVDLGIELAASEADPDGVVLAASLEPAVSRLAAAMPRQEARS